MKRLSNPRITIRIVIMATALICIALGSLTIYKNHKKDHGIDGEGYITVESCRHIGPWDNDYECIGSYDQGSAMISYSSATVKVVARHGYEKGAVIGDVFRDTSVDTEAPAGDQRYISGDVRRGLGYNLPLVGIVAVGLVALSWAIIPWRVTRLR